MDHTLILERHHRKKTFIFIISRSYQSEQHIITYIHHDVLSLNFFPIQTAQVAAHV